MTTARQAKREARQLFRLCLVDGRRDDDRARAVVRRLVETRRTGALRILSCFERLVRLDLDAHRAVVTSAAPLPDDLRAQLAARIGERHGPGIDLAFEIDPTVLGGLRVTVGSELHDGTVKGALVALDAGFAGAA